MLLFLVKKSLVTFAKKARCNGWLMYTYLSWGQDYHSELAPCQDTEILQGSYVSYFDQEMCLLSFEKLF